MKKIVTLALMLSASIIAFGQETEKKTKEKVGDAKKEMADVEKSVNKAEIKTYKDFQEFKRETGKRLDKLDRDIANLSTRVESMDDKAQKKYKEQLKDLREKSKTLRTKLDNYKDDNKSEAFETFQEEFQRDFKHLDKALDDFFVDNKK